MNPYQMMLARLQQAGGAVPQQMQQFAPQFAQGMQNRFQNYGPFGGMQRPMMRPQQPMMQHNWGGGNHPWGGANQMWGNRGNFNTASKPTPY